MVRNGGLIPLALAALLLAACSDRPPAPAAGAAPGIPALEKAAWETARQNALSLRTALAAYRASGTSTRWPEGVLSYPALADFLSDFALPRTEQEAGYAAFTYEGTGGEDYLITITVGNRAGDVITVTPREVSPPAWPGG